MHQSLKPCCISLLVIEPPVAQLQFFIIQNPDRCISQTFDWKSCELIVVKFDSPSNSKLETEHTREYFKFILTPIAESLSFRRREILCDATKTKD